MNARGTQLIAALVLVTTTLVHMGCAPTSGRCYANDVTFLDNADEESVQEIFLADCLSGNLFVENTEIGTLSLPFLEAVGGALVVSSNVILTRVDLPALTTVGLLLEVTQNNVLEELSLPSLDEVGGDFIVRNNPELSLAATEEALDDVEVGGRLVVE